MLRSKRYFSSMSSYFKVDTKILKSGGVNGQLLRIKKLEENGSLKRTNTTFEKAYESDMLSKIDKESKDYSILKRIIDTNQKEQVQTDKVSFFNLTKFSHDEKVSSCCWHKDSNISYLQIDVYLVPENQESKLLNRVYVYGKAVKSYDQALFNNLIEKINNLTEFHIGVNTDEGRPENIEFDKKIELNWSNSDFNAWPSRIKSKNHCYVISQVTTQTEFEKAKVIKKTDSEINKKIIEAAKESAQRAYEHIDSYKIKSSISHQIAEQAKFATTIGISLIMETCGVEFEEKDFEMVEIDVPPNNSQLRVTSIGKGSGFPLMESKSWDHIINNSLHGMSRSPMAVANSIIYNNIVYGNELGRLMGPVDNLFFYDYAIENGDPKFKEWLFGVKRRIEQTLDNMNTLNYTSTLGNIMAYEMIRAKCKVEEVSRKSGQINKRMAIWKDLRKMLHYRVVDAAFLKIVPFCQLTNDELDVIGCATLLHDMVDFGYDVSVKESSNTFLTITEGKIDIDSLKKGYVRTANALQYIIDNYKNDACGLTFLATHFWQMANGRHRIIPSIYNGASIYEHEYLNFGDKKLLDILKMKDTPKGIIKDASQMEQRIREEAKLLGEDAVLLAHIVTVILKENYLGSNKISDSQVEDVERKITELSLSLSVGCSPDNEMTNFLWLICEYMWLNTGMMFSCLVGSTKIILNRKQSDDRYGIGYEWKHN
jgi:hypothetical protein